MKKISIIIPVYNTESYLKRCLESVCNQTLSDIEVICINDCSTDNSLKILKEYDVKIINLEENKGAAYARNIGIEHSSGEYLGFVDSDDFVEPDFYEKLYSKAGSDIIKGCYRYNENNYINNSLNEKIKLYKNNFAFEYCSAIFKASLIKENNIRFPNLKDMEDPIFALTCAVKAKNIEIIDDAYINICRREDSQTAQFQSFERIKDKLNGLSIIIDKMNQIDTVNNGGNFVCALWFFVTCCGIENTDFNSQLYMTKELINLYHKIIDKESFLFHIQKLSTLLYECITSKSQEKLLYYCKDKKMEALNDKLKEVELTSKKLNDYNKFLIDNYAKKELEQSDGSDVYYISVINNYDLYNKCIKQNPFVTLPQNTHLIEFDNTKDNIYIAKRYNSFLNKYNYEKEAWFIFCHCDWEPMENINARIQNLDKSCIYGPVGSKAEIFKNKLVVYLTGFCYEKRRDGSGLRPLGALTKGKEITDTFDCQSMIVHSSLIKKYNLRFDENLKWDLYVEDFCINAKKKYNIPSYSIRLESCHWSGYHITPKSYYQSLEYINQKYPDDSFGGTVSPIGGAKVTIATPKECIIYKLSKNIKDNINA